MAACRFLLGLGEAGNWPGATKAVSEWFPRRETGWAVALFDSGSSIGGAIAPLIVFGLVGWFGSWRPAFIVTGALGFDLAGAVPRSLPTAPRPPASLARGARLHPREAVRTRRDTGEPLGYATLLRLPQTWGYVVSKAFTDPVWFFITDWFAIYLVAKRLSSSRRASLGFLMPFLAADLGNFFGGGVSSILIARGWRVGAARKVIAVIGGLGMMLLIPTRLDVVVRGDRRLLRRRDVLLRRVLDDHPQPAGRRVPVAQRGVGERPRRHRRRPRHHRGDLSHRLGGRSLLVRADPARREPVPLVAMAAVLLLDAQQRATQAGMVKPV